MVYHTAHVVVTLKKEKRVSEIAHDWRKSGYIHIQHVCYITRDIFLYTIGHPASNPETKSHGLQLMFGSSTVYVAAKPTILVE